MTRSAKGIFAGIFLWLNFCKNCDQIVPSCWPRNSKHLVYSLLSLQLCFLDIGVNLLVAERVGDRRFIELMNSLGGTYSEHLTMHTRLPLQIIHDPRCASVHQSYLCIGRRGASLLDPSKYGILNVKTESDEVRSLPRNFWTPGLS